MLSDSFSERTKDVSKTFSDGGKERLRGRGEGVDRGRDGWVASLTQWS